MTERGSLRVGVVGCGVVASAYYLPYVAKHARLVAVCDANPARAAECARIFGAERTYTDAIQMLDSGIEVVLILTGPGSHAALAVQAAERGIHVLIQKPMATTLEDADAIVAAAQRTGVKVLVEPSAATVLQPEYAGLRDLIQSGAIGEPAWFTLIVTGPDTDGPWYRSNPFGAAAFFTADSGGVLFDYAYFPTEVATVLGRCRAVSAVAATNVREHLLVPDSEYDRFLAGVTDPDRANYWDVVSGLERSVPVTMEAPDNVFATYEMASGAIGTVHFGRPHQPEYPGVPAGGLRIYGTEGNLVMGADGAFAAIRSTNRALLPDADPHGWTRIPFDEPVERDTWPKPPKRGFNYYHRSVQHLLDCIDRDEPVLVDAVWGRHVTEMMIGAAISASTGSRYLMTTSDSEGNP